MSVVDRLDVADWEVDARHLATTRVLVASAAGLALLDVADRIGPGLDPERLHVPWPGIGDALIGVDPTLVKGAWGIGAVLLLLGVRSRLAALLVLVGALTYFLADQQHYANGLYLLLVVLFLLTLVDSGTARTPWSSGRRRVSWWPVALLAAQGSIVYASASVQKLRSVSLSGAALEGRLHGVGADLVSWSGLPELLNATGALIEMFCAVGLWFATTRRSAVVLGIGLHLGILVFVGSTFALVGFGCTMVALYSLYGPASDPCRRWRATGSPQPGPSTVEDVV